MEKKKQQLGMNPSTASYVLVKDILFDFVKDRPCYRCTGLMTRENFSVEHKTPWLDANDPVSLYFDLNNIDFSHINCNISAGRRKERTIVHGRDSSYSYGCRCVECTKVQREKKARWRKLSGKH